MVSMVMPSVMVMVYTTHPLLVIPLNIKQLNIFPVPSLLWLVPLSSTPDTTVILMPTDTVLADTMADMVDTVDSVMPTTVKQTNKQTSQKNL